MELDLGYLVVAIEQWPEDSIFDIICTINAPDPQHIHERDSIEGDENDKKGKGADAAEVENDEQTRNSILPGCRRCSGLRPGVPLRLSTVLPVPREVV